MEISTRINSTNDEYFSVQGISANTSSKLLLQFEDFATSSDYYPVISRQASCSNQPPQENLKPASEHCNRLQQPANNLMKLNNFSRFGGEYPSHMKRLSSTQTSSTRNTHSYRYASSSRLTSSQNSPSSTHSSPILHTSNMSSSTQSSPILPSSTHSSPILCTSRTPSPIQGTSFSLLSNTIHMPMHNGVEAPATSAPVKINLTNLASVRDPVTNKIMIKPVNTHQKDKESVSTTSKSVITQELTSNHFPRTAVAAAAATSAKCQLVVKRQPLSSTSFSLPPLSVRGTDDQNQENLPELLKPKNLVKYIEASAPKKKLVEKSSQSVSVLLDHDYSRTVLEEKPVERRLKRTFIIPKKKAANGAVSDRNSEVLDNLEVVDMECSDTENDGSIILDGNGDLVDKNEKSSRGGKSAAAMLYGSDEFSTESKFIDEEAELCYSNEHSHATAICPMYQNILKEIESDLNDTLNWVEKTNDNRCLMGYTNTLGLRTGLWWQEIEELANSTSPDSESSVISHLSEEDEDGEILTASEAAAAISDFADQADSDYLDILQEPGFYSVPSFAEIFDSSADLDNLDLDRLDVQDEIVECSVSEVVVQTEEEIVVPNDSVPRMGQSEAGSLVNGNRSVSPLTSLSQTSSETSDSDSVSPDESKENMVNKVPAYLQNLGRLGTEKNVLQRLNVKQDPESPPGSCNRSWDEPCIKLAFSSDREKNNNNNNNNKCSTSSTCENGSPSTSEFSMSYCRTRSPSPEYTGGRSYSSRLPRRDSYHRKNDRYRQRQRQWSRSRSRSPSYPQKQRPKLKQTTEPIDDEQRRVVYVGKLPNNFTENQLKGMFRSHGEIEKVSLHFRSSKDNYGFVTFKDKGDATRCLEVSNEIPDFPFEVCYGGRREFCKEEYADLDGITEQIEEYGPATIKNEETSYEQLLKQYSRDRKH